MSERLPIFKNAIEHLKHRIEALAGQKENKEISDLLGTWFEPKVKLLDEILSYVDKEDAKHLNEQWDRYHHAICVAIETYLQDLKTTKEKMASISKHAMDFETIDKEIEKTDNLSLQLCERYFATLDNEVRFPTF